MANIKTKLALSAALIIQSVSFAAAPAFAVPANSTTEAAMYGTCAALVTDDELHDGTPVWSYAVLNVVETEGAPAVVDTEIPGTRAGVGTPTYSGLTIAQGTSGADKPYRIGGSVNMFGDQVATTKTYSAGSTYLFDRETTMVTNFTFDCELTKKTETWTPPVIIPGNDHYIVNPSANGNDDENQQACIAATAHGPTWPQWGEDTQQCLFVDEQDTTIPGYWTAGPDVVTTVSNSTSQTDVTVENGLTGTDTTPYVLTGNWFVGQVVICISPSTSTKKGVPGAWRQQNGYTGSNCTTDWFKVAAWGGGSQDSNGTYISVPGY